MKENDNALTGRRRWFLGSLGVVAAGAAVATASSPSAQAQSAAGFVPAKHDKDAWMDALSGVHRAFLDTSTTNGGVTAMNYAHNILLAHVEDYGGKESDYAMIICFRHQATPLGYNDAMWTKYGEILSNFMRFTDSRTEKPFSVNPLDLPGRADFASRGHTLKEMAGRGARYAVCNRATHTISGVIARATGGDEGAIYNELAANIIADGQLVPAGVLAATRSQEYGYSLLYAG